MCGLAGIYAFQGSSKESYLQCIEKMTNFLLHRGPDDSDTWVEENRGIALGHRRLSIVDLSPAGHQPMHSPSGRYVIAFNGEVYSHRVLRAELVQSGISFNGNSDTEVMLAAIDAWGLDHALSRFVGMFAFALWDKEQSTLHLVRDRLGIKPLYYLQEDGLFAFASELKAFHALPGWAPSLDRQAAGLMLRHGYVPGEYSIFTNVRKLLPGHHLKVSLRDGNVDFGSSRPYWSLQDIAACMPELTSETQAKENMAHLIEQAVVDRMVADVPLGAFLSGGIDSTLVAAAMQRQAGSAVKTYSIGFEDKRYDEADDARRVAEYLGCEHHELYVSEKDILACIEKMPDVYDEPFADPSQLPTYLLCALTKQHVTVALSGDGGDELCGGYTRHFESVRIARLLGMPAGLRRVLAGFLTRVPMDAWDRMPVLGRRYRLLGDKVHKLGRLLAARDGAEVYRVLTSASDRVSFDTSDVLPALPRDMKLGEQLIYYDTLRYLPDDVLTKVDRASMAVSLEVRVPLLDHRLIEFAWRLPFHMKVRNGEGKWLLRQVLADWLPRELWDRPKMGFSVPIGEWLRGELKPWAEHYLLSEAHYTHGILNLEDVQRLWQEHQAGRGNHQYQLWNILMFHAWHERWMMDARVA